MLIKKLFEIEWRAQRLLLDYKLQGLMVDILRSDIQPEDSDIIVIQGSFDPPLHSHKELITNALKRYKKLNPSKNVILLVLFSLSHVEKKINLQENSLLGYRIPMITEMLGSSSQVRIPVWVGLSNVGRYYELTEGILKKFPEANSIYYIMGTDVFIKIFDSKYYETEFINLIDKIFKSNYIVAGRETITSKEDFTQYLKSLDIPKIFLKQIFFIEISKGLWYENSTRIRHLLSTNANSDISVMPTSVSKFLNKHAIYSKDSLIIISEYVIQHTAIIAVQEGLESGLCLKAVRKVISEIKKDTQLQEKIGKQLERNNTQLLEESIRKWLK